jgi:Transcriptional regulatory protein, C terminal
MGWPLSGVAVVVGSQDVDVASYGGGCRGVPLPIPHRPKPGLGLLGVPSSYAAWDLLPILAPLRLTWFTVHDPRALLATAQLAPPSAVVLHPTFAATTMPELVTQLRQVCPCPILLIHVVGELAAATCGADGEVNLASISEESTFATSAGAGALVGAREVREGRDSELRWDPLRLDLPTRSAYWHDRLLAVSELQFRLLWALGEARGGVVGFVELSRAVYGDRGDSDRGRIQAHVARIRRLVEQDPTCPSFLLTVRGRGFRFTDC